MSNTKLKMNYITVIIIVMAIALVLSTSGCFGKDTASTPTTTKPVTSTHIETGDSAIDAKIVSITFDKANYKAGDKVTAVLMIKNTGTVEITSEKIDITAKLLKLKSTAANLALKAVSAEKKTRSYSMPYKVSIQPDETKELSAVFTTKKELEGISLAGEYDIYIKLYVNNMKVGSSSLLLKLD